ncbi:hypothetical protein MPH_04380 [Macrophomina phaseolina MS6]|uniref:Zn(2)-C6 fungal-type domain-containing protein n=1 Tax=Macrophomina phaseolina (strain MS6) TaxID=1126212 RepID=K2S7M0_MACPH|nr:hypothetical protein MPH_04380 [Macrophomina phaseolina MS6]
MVPTSRPPPSLRPQANPNRPTCARCRETGIECTWPPQLQRGPAKGYLEAIEARLDDVEHILLQVLPLIPRDQLMNSVTCPSDSASHVVDSNQKRTTQEKRAALDYWASFPLNSPQAVLSWCNDRLRRDSARRPHQLTSSYAEQPPDASRSMQPQLTEAVMDDAGPHQPDSANAMESPWPVQHLSYGAGPPDPQSANTPEAPPPTSSQPPGQILAAATHRMQGPQSMSRRASNDRFDLSDEFHAKFLW